MSSAEDDSGLPLSAFLLSWLSRMEETDDKSSLSASTSTQESQDTMEKWPRGREEDASCSVPQPLKNIAQDCKRTFTDLAFFNEQSGSGRQQLEAVLTALAGAFPQIGYCQGMNFIAAFFLYSLRESNKCIAQEICFRVMHILFSSEKHDLRANFLPGMLQTQIRVFQFDQLMKSFTPDLYSHFERIGLTAEYFVLTFLLPLFSNKLPFAFLDTFFPLFLVHGWRAAFSTLLFVLNFYKARLLYLGPSEISKFFARGNEALQGLCSSTKEQLFESFKVLDSRLDFLEAEFISLKLGIDAGGCSSPVRGEELHFCSEEVVEVERLQGRLASFNQITKNDSFSMQEKIEYAERDKEHYSKVWLKLASRVMNLRIEVEDHEQARSAIRGQISLLKEMNTSYGEDIRLLEEKIVWIAEEVGEKTSLLLKLECKLKAAEVCLEESVEKKEAFSEQLLRIVTSAEERKQEELRQLKHLV